MHKYKFNSRKWASETGHLTPMEECAYRLLVDLYYECEGPIPSDPEVLARKIRMAGHEDVVSSVLSEFFFLEATQSHSDDPTGTNIAPDQNERTVGALKLVYRHFGCDDKIAKELGKAKTAKIHALCEKVAKHRVNTACPSESVDYNKVYDNLTSINLTSNNLTALDNLKHNIYIYKSKVLDRRGVGEVVGEGEEKTFFGKFAENAPSPVDNFSEPVDNSKNANGIIDIYTIDMFGDSDANGDNSNIRANDSSEKYLRAAITVPDEPVKNTSSSNNRSANEKNGKRLPEDWSPSEEEILFCKTARPELDWREVVERFRDYWISQPGARGRKINWTATWRNWVRNEGPVRPKRGAASGAERGLQQGVDYRAGVSDDGSF